MLGMSILEGELAAALTAALIDANVPYAITITREVATGPADPPWEPPPTDVVDYDCQGWVDAYTADEIDGTLILQSDVKVIVLLSTIAKGTGEPPGAPATITPAVGDSVTVRDNSYLVISVQTDPALATVTLQVRA